MTFAIRANDLTDEGLELMKKGYDKWLRRLDMGRSFSDVKILEKTLKGHSQ